MKKIKIYEPAMCCSTGICGVGIDPELLRISTVINNLNKIGVIIERYNLSNAPQEFLSNKIVNEFINNNGIEKLPFIISEEEIILTGRYPSNEEISKIINIPIEKFAAEIESKKKNGCGCNGGCK